MDIVDMHLCGIWRSSVSAMELRVGADKATFLVRAPTRLSPMARPILLPHYHPRALRAALNCWTTLNVHRAVL